MRASHDMSAFSRKAITLEEGMAELTRPLFIETQSTEHAEKQYEYTQHWPHSTQAFHHHTAAFPWHELIFTHIYREVFSFYRFIKRVFQERIASLTSHFITYNGGDIIGFHHWRGFHWLHIYAMSAAFREMLRRMRIFVFFSPVTQCRFFILITCHCHHAAFLSYYNMSFFIHGAFIFCCFRGEPRGHDHQSFSAASFSL